MSVDVNSHLYTNMNFYFSQFKPAEKMPAGSEGAAEGGCGGNSAAPEPKRSPAALLVQSRSQQKSFLFLL